MALQVWLGGSGSSWWRGDCADWWQLTGGEKIPIIVIIPKKILNGTSKKGILSFKIVLSANVIILVLLVVSLLVYSLVPAAPVLPLPLWTSQPSRP